MPSAIGGELRWPVRASFLRYVAALPDGRASVSEGAALTADDPQLVVYPVDPGATTPDVLAFAGDLRLGGHGGLLFVRLAAPRIEFGAGAEAVLSVDDPLTEDGSGPRMRLATLTVQATESGWTGTNVRLTADGVGLFNHVYQAGEAFDDLVVRRT